MEGKQAKMVAIATGNADRAASERSRVDDVLRKRHAMMTRAPSAYTMTFAATINAIESTLDLDSTAPISPPGNSSIPKRQFRVSDGMMSEAIVRGLVDTRS